MKLLLSFFILIVPISINILHMKYLYDVREQSDCESINSPYINLFFNFYLIELCLSILAVMLIGYIISYIGLELNFKPNKKIISIKNKKAASKVIKIITKENLYLITNFVSKNQYIFKLFTLLVSGVLLKLLYDISNEDECKNIDKKTRIFLYIVQIMGFLVISYSTIFK